MRLCRSVPSDLFAVAAVSGFCQLVPSSFASPPFILTEVYLNYEHGCGAMQRVSGGLKPCQFDPISPPFLPFLI